MYKIGLDLGSKTCGISIADDKTNIAVGLTNFKYTDHNMMLIIHKLKKIIDEYENKINLFVLGYPINLKVNIKNESMIRVDTFKVMLENNFPNIKIELVDENYSTVRASTALFDTGIKSSQRKKVIDMISAVVILQDYIDKN